MFGLDLLFPRQVKCIFCNHETSRFGICDNCLEILPKISGKTCFHCGGRMIGGGDSCVECKNKKFYFERCFSVLEYDGEVRNQMSSFKESGRRHIGEAFAHLIEAKFLETNENVDIIIPVPIGADRLKTRGFNQSEVLCGELLEIGKVKTDILLRPQDTPHQTGLDRQHREKNLRGAFKVSDKSLVKGKRIMLVDDIYTTGSTLNECARTLVEAGASGVVAMVLCRTPIRESRLIR